MQRVRGDLEVFRAPGLQPERPPDPVHAGRRDPHPLGQLPFGPMRGPLGHLFQVRTTTSSTWASVIVRGTPDAARHPARPAGWPGTGPPFGHRVAADAQPAATAMLLCPSALASTIRARNARSCAVLRASPSSLMCVVRPATTPAAPAWDLPSSQHAALRPPCHRRTSQLKLKATQVVIGNSRPGHQTSASTEPGQHPALPSAAPSTSPPPSARRHDHGHGGGPPTLSADHLLRVSTERRRAAPSRTRRWPARRSGAARLRRREVVRHR